MNKQTAVQFLIEKIHFDANVRCFSQVEWNEIFEQANQMYKEQMWDYIKKKYCIGDKSLEFHKLEFEDYYNETYGGNNDN
jgi:hypothetical protein